MLDRSDIQGLVLDAQARTPESAALLLRFGTARLRDWLGRIVPRIGSARGVELHDPTRLYLAFTHRGLAALGLPELVLGEFPAAFREGMAAPARSRLLGDVGDDAPERWEFSDGSNGVDALLLVYARGAAELEGKLGEIAELGARFGVEAQPIRTYLPRDGAEHFGFRMGVSEPRLRGQRRRGRDALAPGEVLLGHPNGYGERSPSPRAPRLSTTRAQDLLVLEDGRVDFGRNGSFLAVRKLEQRVSEFWELARREAALDSSRGELAVLRAAARFVGRWPNGAPLVLYPDAPPAEYRLPDRFGYRELDPLGRACPFGAHVRRAHPRDGDGPSAAAALRAANLHRILRRGRLYGPKLDDPRAARDDGVERGLLFVALNADLERQFETLQGARFGAGPSQRGEQDPLLGRAADGPSARRFTIPGTPVRRVTSALPELIRVRGGAYFFLPSLAALGYLADLGRPSA